MLVDSHCHLNYKGLVEQQADVLVRARANGVSAMLNISTRESEWDEVVALAEQEADVWASVGIHPHEAHYLKLDISKAKARLDWQPRWALQQALQASVEWHQQWLAGADMKAVTHEQISSY